MTSETDRGDAYGLPTNYDDGDLVDDIRDKKHGSYGAEFDLDYPVACARVRQYCARIRADAVRVERENASSREQESREDERRRCAERVESERITPENTDGALLSEGNAAYNRAIDHAKAAILQGTEPAKRSCPECGTAIQENGWGCHHAYDCSMGAHHFTDADFPAKVSEDVERVADRLATELAGIAVSSRRNDPEACEQMICDMKARLVARLREGNRG